jgi:hypothetical protein
VPSVSGAAMSASTAALAPPATAPPIDPQLDLQLTQKTEAAIKQLLTDKLLYVAEDGSYVLSPPDTLTASPWDKTLESWTGIQRLSSTAFTKLFATEKRFSDLNALKTYVKTHYLQQPQAATSEQAAAIVSLDSVAVQRDRRAQETPQVLAPLTDEATQISNTVEGRQYDCHTAALNNNGLSITVWYEASPADIVAQVFQTDESGKQTKVGSPFQVSTVEGNPQSGPNVIALDDYFVVAWHGRFEGDTTITGVKGQLYRFHTDKTPEKVGGQFPISATDTDSTSGLFPDMVRVKENRFFVVYRDHNDNAVKGRVFDVAQAGNSVPVGGPIVRINPSYSTNIGYPKVAQLSETDYIVVSGGSDIEAQRIKINDSGDISLYGERFTVTTLSDSQGAARRPALLALNNEFVAVGFEEEGDFPPSEELPSSNSPGIYLQMLRASTHGSTLEKIGEPQWVNAETEYSQKYISLYKINAQKFTATFTSVRQISSAIPGEKRAVSADGSINAFTVIYDFADTTVAPKRLGPEIRLNAGVSYVGYPQIVSDGHGNALAIWSQYTNDEISTENVVAQTFAIENSNPPQTIANFPTLRLPLSNGQAGNAQTEDVYLLDYFKAPSGSGPLKYSLQQLNGDKAPYWVDINTNNLQITSPSFLNQTGRTDILVSAIANRQRAELALAVFIDAPLTALPLGFRRVGDEFKVTPSPRYTSNTTPEMTAFGPGKLLTGWYRYSRDTQEGEFVSTIYDVSSHSKTPELAVDGYSVYHSEGASPNHNQLLKLNNSEFMQLWEGLSDADGGGVYGSIFGRIMTYDGSSTAPIGKGDIFRINASIQGSQSYPKSVVLNDEGTLIAVVWTSIIDDENKQLLGKVIDLTNTQQPIKDMPEFTILSSNAPAYWSQMERLGDTHFVVTWYDARPIKDAQSGEETAAGGNVYMQIFETRGSQTPIAVLAEPQLVNTGIENDQSRVKMAVQGNTIFLAWNSFSIADDGSGRLQRNVVARQARFEDGALRFVSDDFQINQHSPALSPNLDIIFLTDEKVFIGYAVGEQNQDHAEYDMMGRTYLLSNDAAPIPMHDEFRLHRYFKDEQRDLHITRLESAAADDTIKFIAAWRSDHAERVDANQGRGDVFAQVYEFNPDATAISSSTKSTSWYKCKTAPLVVVDCSIYLRVSIRCIVSCCCRSS